MYPFEAVLSHIEMYCDFTEVPSQEGSVSCATNHVVCSVTKCWEQSHAPQQRLSKQVRSQTQRQWTLSLCAVWFRNDNSETWLVKIESSFCLFFFFCLSDFMDNVTLSYANSVFLKLWYTSAVQHTGNKNAALTGKRRKYSVRLGLVLIACLNTGIFFFLEIR